MRRLINTYLSIVDSRSRSETVVSIIFTLNSAQSNKTSGKPLFSPRANMDVNGEDPDYDFPFRESVNIEDPTEKLHN